MNSLVNSMCADRGGGLNETKNLLDRHTQTSVGLLEVRYCGRFCQHRYVASVPADPLRGPQQMKGYGSCRPVLRSRSSVTDTSDTVLRGNPANERNYRNSSQRSNLLVTGSNTGYYRGSVGFTALAGNGGNRIPLSPPDSTIPTTYALGRTPPAEPRII